MDELKKWVKELHSKGYPKSQIEEALLDKGYSKSQIDNVFSDLDDYNGGKKKVVLSVASIMVIFVLVGYFILTQYLDENGKIEHIYNGEMVECGRDLDCFLNSIENCESASYIELGEDFEQLEDGVEKTLKIVGSENGRCIVNYNITEIDPGHPWGEGLDVGDGRVCYYEPEVLEYRVSTPLIGFDYVRENCEGEVIP